MRLLHLMRKELLELRRDPRLFGIVIIAPIIQLTMLGYAASTDVTNVPTLIVDADQSAESRALVSQFEVSRNFVVVDVLTAGASVAEYLDAGRAWMAVSSPHDYGARVRAGQAVAVQVVADGTDANSTNVAVGYVGALVAGQPALVACTPAGVMAMLRHHEQAHDWHLSGRHAVVIGRSLTVGKPMALLLLAAHCTVTICHSRTVDLPGHLASADLVVAAAGVPELVRGEWLRPGAVVIDVGIHRRPDGSLCGDVHLPSAGQIASAISPVPGGVGPMTIAMLLANTVDACRRRRGPSTGRDLS